MRKIRSAHASGRAVCRYKVQPDHVSLPKLHETGYKVHLVSVRGYKLHLGSAERAGIPLQKLGIVPKEDPCDCTRSRFALTRPMARG